MASNPLQQVSLKIFCFVIGERDPFPIDIQSDMTVDDLKDAIKLEKANDFANIAANNLTLYLVNIPDDDDLENNARQQLNIKPALRATKKLSTLFPGTPTEETVHILVQIPNLDQPSHIIRDPYFPFRNYYTDPNGSRVDFTYDVRLADDKLLFCGSSGGDKHNLLVKFTQKYSKDAHEYCASHKIAPDMYAVEEMGGGWMMVVMEYLDSDTYTMLRFSDAPESIVRPAIVTAVATLHQGNFVHGDIRDVNVMVGKQWDQSTMIDLKLVDFDWAGQEGMIRYPANISHYKIRRPSGVKDGQFITKSHDNEMVEFLFVAEP